MMDHRRTRSKRYRDATYQDLLADDAFVSRQLLDYQTKMLAFDSLDECAESVNVPLDIDDTRFDRALERLPRVDVLGVVEDLPAFTRRLERVTGIRPGPERSANRARGERAPLDATVRRRLAELTARDQVLYDRARELIADEGRGRASLRRLRERCWTRR
jgi:hypothetical protein